MPYIGALLVCAGIAGVLGSIPWLAAYTYPIIWWGLLIIADGWNMRRRNLSLWRGRWRHFSFITLPTSVLFWLLFEALNLAAPQWRYRGSISDVHAQVAFGFAAFATVIPIIVETWWVVAGPICVAARMTQGAHRLRWPLAGAAAVLMAIPLVNDVFWWNQGMWLVPALLILPFVRMPVCGTPRAAVTGVVFGGLLAGFAWESINYWGETKWEYLILRGWPHVFEMPVLGYLGFIPFTISAAAVYEWQLRIKPRASIGVALYTAATLALYALTIEYMRRGLWIVALQSR